VGPRLVDDDRQRQHDDRAGCQLAGGHAHRRHPPLAKAPGPHRGKPLLVNLWASWCAPCVKELPTLDRLATSNAAVRVLAVSQDMGPHASVVAFLDQHKIADLEAFQDPKMALSGGLGVEVMPTTLLYDAQGREVWRYVGELDWTSGEAARLLAEAGPGGATRH
jgi:thiol-disulfide isomerase/thioredoxin